MKRCIGWILIAISIIVLVYVGGWICLVEPIINIIKSIIATGTVTNILIHACKIVFGTLVSLFISWVLMMIGGMVLICADDEEMMKKEE